MWVSYRCFHPSSDDIKRTFLARQADAIFRTKARSSRYAPLNHNRCLHFVELCESNSLWVLVPLFKQMSIHYKHSSTVCNKIPRLLYWTIYRNLNPNRRLLQCHPGARCFLPTTPYPCSLKTCCRQTKPQIVEHTIEDHAVQLSDAESLKQSSTLVFDGSLDLAHSQYRPLMSNSVRPNST